MAKGYVLSENDREALKRFMDRTKGGRINSGRDWEEENDHQAPEVYVARTPTGGIPQLDEGSGVGTGTSATDSPGRANCDIYRVKRYGDVPELEDVPNFSKLVYNLAGDLIPGNQWVIVVRDKYGDWFVVNANASGNGSGSSDRILVRLTDKTYTANEFVRYSWERVTDSLTPTPVTYTTGSAGVEPAYEVNDNDLGVPTITYLRPGAGSWYLIDEQPLWDFVQKTAPQQGGYFPGNRVYWDMDSNTVQPRYEIRIVDLNVL